MSIDMDIDTLLRQAIDDLHELLDEPDFSTSYKALEEAYLQSVLGRIEPQPECLANDVEDIELVREQELFRTKFLTAAALNLDLFKADFLRGVERCRGNVISIGPADC